MDAKETTVIVYAAESRDGLNLLIFIEDTEICTKNQLRDTAAHAESKCNMLTKNIYMMM